ncbi:hypothetical protein D1872_301520 [compost metagenome]
MAQHAEKPAGEPVDFIRAAPLFVGELAGQQGRRFHALHRQFVQGAQPEEADFASSPFSSLRAGKYADRAVGKLHQAEILHAVRPVE